MTARAAGAKTPRSWFRFQAQADEPGVQHLYIYDAIGPWYMGDDPVSAKQFLDALKALPQNTETIRVHISSPGGDVGDALAIANSLRMHRARVETSIEGMAASAATIVSSVGEKIAIFDNAVVMIHDPWAFAIGNARDLRKLAEDLDRFRDQIIATYRLNSKLEPEKLAALMANETWMTADEALANGFAHEKLTGLKVAAFLRPTALDRLGKIPANFRARLNDFVRAADDDEDEDDMKNKARAESVDPDEDGNCPEGYEKGDDGMCHLKDDDAAAKARAHAGPAADPLAIVRACREAGCQDLAEELIAAKLPLDAVKARVSAEANRRAKAAARAKEIRNLCQAAKLPELADGYVNGAMTVDDVKKHLTAVTAIKDRTEIDGGLKPDETNPGASWAKAIAKVQGTRKGAGR